MKVETDVRGNRILVHCTGRMDAAGGPEVEMAVMPLFRSVEGVRPSPVILDLAGVDYLSSAGIRSLLAILRAAKQVVGTDGDAGTLFRITNQKALVEGVLRMSGVLDERGEWCTGARKAAPQPAVDYRKHMDLLRQAFPAPTSNPVKDAYFVHTITKGLDRLDDLKTQRPYLGKRVQLDYGRARKAVCPERMSTVEETIRSLAGYLEGMTIWGHPAAQINVVPPPSIPAIVGNLFASIYNPNIIWDVASHRLAEAEVEVVSMCASLVGYDPAKAGGVFTFGGTGTVFYGVKLGLEKAQPGAFTEGIRGPIKVVASDVSHYAKVNALAWLGLGANNLVTVPSDEDNAMGLSELETALLRLLDCGERIACIVATLGTTDAFGVDNLEYIVRLRDRLVEEYHLSYKPHVHADAVIGWAWSVFNDYDFAQNPMDFPPRTLRSLWDAQTGIRAINLADSVGLDFHKTGFVPYISSLFICKNGDDLKLISRDKALMPYLFQWGGYHPGVFTLETSRAGSSVLSAWASLTFLGKEGFRVLLGHLVTIAEALRRRLERCPWAALVNDYNYGPVTLFRVYPDGVDAHAAYAKELHDPEAKEMLVAHNAYNRRVFDALLRQLDEGRGVAVSMTDAYRRSASGEPLSALKSYVMSPFAEESIMDTLMECLESARRELRQSARV